MKTKSITADISIAPGERAVVARISTADVDRDGDVMVAQGMLSKGYERNPVLLSQHNMGSLPVGRCVALSRDTNSVVAKFIFASRPPSHPESDEWFADTLLSLYREGVMNAFSVGFRIVSARPASKSDIATFGPDCRQIITRWELLEVSCVTVPANENAVMIAVGKGLLTRAKAKRMFGIDCIDRRTPVRTAEPGTKHVVYHLTAPPQKARLTPKGIQRLVRQRIEKLRGRIYASD